jgi:hypothetical protein
LGDFLERRGIAVFLHEVGDEVVHLPLSPRDGHARIVGEIKANVKGFVAERPSTATGAARYSKPADADDMDDLAERFIPDDHGRRCPNTVADMIGRAR